MRWAFEWLLRSLETTMSFTGGLVLPRIFRFLCSFVSVTDISVLGSAARLVSAVLSTGHWPGPRGYRGPELELEAAVNFYC